MFGCFLSPRTTMAAFAGLTIAGAAILAPATAHAQAFTVDLSRRFTGFQNRAILRFDSTLLTSPTDGSITAGLREFDDFVGALRTTPTGVVPSGVPAGPFDSYCVDFTGVVGTANAQLQNPAGSGHTQYNVTARDAALLSNGNHNSSPAATDAQRGGSIAYLFNTFNVSAGSDATGQTSASLQLAIWEVLYDWNGTAFVGGTNSSVNLGTGNFRYQFTPQNGNVAGDTPDVAVTAAILTGANTMLSNWAAQLSTGTWLDTTDVVPANVAGLAGQPRQDLITTRIVTAPEPGTAGLLGAPALAAMGLSALRFVVRRRRA